MRVPSPMIGQHKLDSRINSIRDTGKLQLIWVHHGTSMSLHIGFSWFNGTTPHTSGPVDDDGDGDGGGGGGGGGDDDFDYDYDLVLITIVIWF